MHARSCGGLALRDFTRCDAPSCNRLPINIIGCCDASARTIDLRIFATAKRNLARQAKSPRARLLWHHDFTASGQACRHRRAGSAGQALDAMCCCVAVRLLCGRVAATYWWLLGGSGTKLVRATCVQAEGPHVCRPYEQPATRRAPTLRSTPVIASCTDCCVPKVS